LRACDEWLDDELEGLLPRTVHAREERARRGRERLQERSQVTVVTGIGPVDRDGAPDVESYQ
jgi:hypothetical protein